MDAKSAFLNGVIYEEVYVKQPPEFEDLKHLEYVFTVKVTIWSGISFKTSYDCLPKFLANRCRLVLIITLCWCAFIEFVGFLTIGTRLCGIFRQLLVH